MRRRRYGHGDARRTAELIWAWLSVDVLVTPEGYQVAVEILAERDHLSLEASAQLHQEVLVGCWPAGACALVGFGGLILLWEGLAGLAGDHPLTKEKAHGDADRATPDQTTTAAGGRQRDPLQEQQFRD